MGDRNPRRRSFVIALIVAASSRQRMDVNDSPDVEFPFSTSASPSPGGATTDWNAGTQRESCGPGSSGVEEISSRCAKEIADLVQFEIGTPVDRATTEVRDASTKIRGDLPRGSSSRRLHAAMPQPAGAVRGLTTT